MERKRLEEQPCGIELPSTGTSGKATFVDAKKWLGGEGSSSKSTKQVTFGTYLSRKMVIEEAMQRMYTSTIFRRQRYRAFVGKRSSMDKFLSRLRTMMDKADKGRKKRKHVIVVGNGIGTNAFNRLKHQSSSLTTSMLKELALRADPKNAPLIVRVPEAYTSSTCFACEGTEMVHPCRRTYTDSSGNERTKDVHHLLKCTNQACKNKHWHRDVLGMSNIGKQAVYWLKHRAWAPCFTTGWRRRQAA